MSNADEHETNRLAVLRAAARAVAASREPAQGAPVDHVAFELGRRRPDLLNSRRERLMTELRRDDLLSYHVFNGTGGRWRPTAAGYALLEAAVATHPEEIS